MTNLELRTWNVTKVCSLIHGSYYQGHWDWDMDTKVQYKSRKYAVRHVRKLARSGVNVNMAG